MPVPVGGYKPPSGRVMVDPDAVADAVAAKKPVAAADAKKPAARGKAPPSAKAKVAKAAKKK